MKVISLIAKIIFSLLIACSVLVLVVQEDTWGKMMLERYLINLFDKAYNSCCTCRVASYNLLQLAITIEDIEVTPHDQAQAWSWSCKKYTMQGSWWQLLTRGVLEVTSTSRDCMVFSALEGTQLAIADHIKALFESPLVLPITVKDFFIHHALIDINDSTRAIEGTLGFNGHGTITGNKCKTAFSVTHRHLINGHASPYLSDLGGSLEGEIISRPTGFDVQATTQLTFTVPSLPEHQNKFVMSGSFKDGSGYFDIHNNEYTIGGSIASIGESLVLQSSTTLPIAFIEALVSPDTPPATSGLMTLHVHADVYDLDNLAHVQLTLDNPHYATYGVRTLALESQARTGIHHITLNVKTDHGPLIQGNATFDIPHKKASLQCTGTLTSLSWLPAPHVKLQAEVTDNTLQGSCTLESNGTAEPVKAQASMSGTLDATHVEGTLNDATLTLDGALWPLPRLYNITCRNQQGADLLHAHLDETTLDASISMQIIKGLMHHYADIDLHGEGTINVQSQQSAHDASSTLTFSGGTVRIANLYNGVTDIQASGIVSWRNRSVNFSELQATLHKGTITSSNALLQWDEQGALSLSMPFTLHDCFVSHHKDFFAILSGSGVLTNNQEKTTVTGALSIDRSHLKGNVLAGDVHHDILMPLSLRANANKQSQSPYLDITVTTKKPMKVKTPFLQTNALVNGTIKGTIAAPTATGTIELVGGSLLFPYKPLYITSGKIIIMPQQPDDLTIELYAKNIIKKYTVSVVASGTLKKPKIVFSSSPPLSEEQIITLLCSGSEDAGILAAVPSVIMHAIQRIIFGSAEEATSFSKYLKKIFRPLGTIRVVPIIGDSKEHTGLQASVEIAINDRLHGLVCKNLNAPEETRLELEYALSDEVSVRATKDERGDVGAELEFRLSV